MKMQTLNSRWMRLTLSLVACPIFDWILWRGGSKTPGSAVSSWIENIVLEPGTMLALLLVGVHGRLMSFLIVEFATTSLVIFAITYGLLTIIARALEDRLSRRPSAN